MNRRDFHRGSLALCGTCLAWQRATAGMPPGQTRFALVGDTPYGEGETDDFAAVLEHAAADSDFIVHVGDIKSGTESCDDALLAERLTLLTNANKPLVFVPGDNEWTDCHRVLAGAFDPAERLSALRRLAYQGHLPTTPPGLERQSADWPEHQRWAAGPSLFVTLNIPGSDNALRTRIDQLAHRERATAATAWLVESAALARERELPVLTVVIHANVELHRLHGSDPDTDIIAADNPYAWFRGLLWQVICRFPGQVLLLNGDQHVQIDDRPWQYGRFARVAASRFGVPLNTVQARMSRFRRLQTFGSPWSRVYQSVTMRAAGSGSVGIDVAIRHI